MKLRNKKKKEASGSSVGGKIRKRKKKKGFFTKKKFVRRKRAGERPGKGGPKPSSRIQPGKKKKGLARWMGALVLMRNGEKLTKKHKENGAGCGKRKVRGEGPAKGVSEKAAPKKNLNFRAQHHEKNRRGKTPDFE